jgi:signal transduction histidine kinase
MKQTSITRHAPGNGRARAPDEASELPGLTAVSPGRESVPEAPDACTRCGNSVFVAGVLEDLKSGIEESRRYRVRLRHMASRVLSAQEEERKHIARELHDDTAQALTSILVRLRLLERSTKDRDVLNNVEELRELTAGALDSVRRMALDLRPAALDDLGLVPALQAYAQRYAQTWPVAVTVEVRGLKRRLPSDVELVLYRIVQEALSNIAKHAFATRAHVSLTRRRNTVLVAVEDDGVGFDPHEVPRVQGSGLGIFGMRERMALVGGDIEVRSSKGSGTKVTAKVPLAANVRPARA